MWLLSSWTNFLVTDSSIICFTCQWHVMFLGDSFINRPPVVHTHTVKSGRVLYIFRGNIYENLETVFLYTKKNTLRLKSCEEEKHRVESMHVKLVDESPAFIPRTSTGKWEVVHLEVGECREGRRIHPSQPNLCCFPQWEQLILLRQKGWSYSRKPNSFKINTGHTHTLTR